MLGLFCDKSLASAFNLLIVVGNLSDFDEPFVFEDSPVIWEEGAGKRQGREKTCFGHWIFLWAGNKRKKTSTTTPKKKAVRREND